MSRRGYEENQWRVLQSDIPRLETPPCGVPPGSVLVQERGWRTSSPYSNRQRRSRSLASLSSCSSWSVMHSEQTEPCTVRVFQGKRPSLWLQAARGRAGLSRDDPGSVDYLDGEERKHRQDSRHNPDRAA